MREALKEICRRIIFPPTAIVLGGVPITAALMSYVFGFGHDDDPVAYVAYLVSAYSFAVLCIWASCRAKPLVRAVREWLQRIPLANRFLSDHAFRWMATLRFSTLANIFYAAMKLWMGIAYQSLWFITFAVYYMLLLGMRILLVRGITPERLGVDWRLENRRYRICGVILLFLNMALSGMVLLAIHDDQSVHYPGMMIYAAAAYDFYIITMAIINLAKVRKHGSPVLSAARVIGFSSALIAMLCLETAMISEFGGKDDPYFRNITIALTGLVISIILIGASVRMLLISGKRLREGKETEG